MTIDLHGSVGASSTPSQDWKSLPWDKIRQRVRRLQMRIAKAIKEKRYGKAKALQWILTHSHSAKLLAVKRVTTNKGARTPGVDKKVWRTDGQKLAAITLLRRRGYKPQPLRRIYIKKKNAIALTENEPGPLTKSEPPPEGGESAFVSIRSAGSGSCAFRMKSVQSSCA